MHLVIDAANVVGSRPDGWWRDRSGAARRLVEAVAEALCDGRLASPVTVVLEGAARSGVPAGPVAVTAPAKAPPAETPSAEAPPAADVRPLQAAELRIQHADRDGDSAIVDLVASIPGDVLVVTADRELRRLVGALGADVVGPSWLRERI